MTEETTTIVQEDYAALVTGTASDELEVHRQSVCSVERYSSEYLKNVPKTVVEADLGCGNPTKYLKEGDTVLDIGSGAGMNCYIAAQIVGEKGEVIGVDFTSSMLEVARSSEKEFRSKVSSAAPLRFVAAAANDLALDLEWAEAQLSKTPITSNEALRSYLSSSVEQRSTNPAIKNNSIDSVISNCVINLLDDVDKPSVFREISRVLKPGGNFAISDNVSNIVVPDAVKNDRVMWSACYAGVLQEQEFYKQLEDAGFVNIRVEVRNPDPALTIKDLVFYSITVIGEKPVEANTVAAEQSVMYRGPLKAVVGDSGKIYRRGKIEELAPMDRNLMPHLEAVGFMATEEFDIATAGDSSSCCG